MVNGRRTLPSCEMTGPLEGSNQDLEIWSSFHVLSDASFADAFVGGKSE